MGKIPHIWCPEHRSVPVLCGKENKCVFFLHGDFSWNPHLPSPPCFLLEILHLSTPTLRLVYACLPSLAVSELRSLSVPPAETLFRAVHSRQDCPE